MFRGVYLKNKPEKKMGIKPTYIKALGMELLAGYGNRFSNNFDENKQIVTEVTSVESKRVRNRVAGYITRKVNTGRH
jgi:small subunit ribosomal protein S17e